MNVEETLVMLGIDYEEANGEYRAPCPMHKHRTGREDHNPSWYISADKGLHICFSCGYKGSLVGLIADLKGLDYGQAKALVVEGRDEIEASSIRRRMEQATTWVARRRGAYLPESSLAEFDRPPSWALCERRLDAEACKEFGVMWSHDGSWILPIRDPYTDALMGWQVKSQVTKGFVRNRPNGVKKSETLFWVGVPTTSDQDIWVVESPLDAVRLYGVGVSAMATFGARVSLTQMGLLSSYNRIVLAFDNDDAGRQATDEFLYYTRSQGLDILEVIYPDGCKDPGDCTDAQLADLRPRHTVRR